VVIAFSTITTISQVKLSSKTITTKMSQDTFQSSKDINFQHFIEVYNSYQGHFRRQSTAQELNTTINSYSGTN
jgi:hypothetical protein